MVKISTSLIQVDVTVSDKNGNAVTDLKPGDVEIYENGKKQEITNFSFIPLASTSKPIQTIKTETAAGAGNKTTVVLPPVRLSAEQVRRTYAIVIDDLGLSFSSSYWIKGAVRKFITEQMQEGDLVAILMVSRGIGALQSFTSDKRQLLAAAEKIKWNGTGRVGVNSYEPIREATQQVTGREERTMGGKMTEGAKEALQSATSGESRRQTNSAYGTMGALRYVIRGMGELPGRKSLILFSEGFQLIDYSKPIPETLNTIPALRSLADVANRASVVIYTMDPRGLIAPGAGTGEAADDISASSRPVGQASRFSSLAIREKVLVDSQNSLRYLANETGGIPYVDQNNINYGMQKVLDDQKGYYLIGYQPNEDAFDPKKSKFNELKVKVNRPDLKVRYRSGFFGVSDEKLKAVPQTPQQKLNAALVSPFGANGVNLDLYSIFINNGEDKNFIRSFVRIKGDDLKFTQEADGKHKASIEIMAMTFAENGAPIDQTAKNYTFQLTEEKYQSVLRQGLVYDLLLPVKKPGAYQFRIALRDTNSEKIGAASQFIEIPDVGKKELTLSNVIVKSYSIEDWKNISAKQENDKTTSDSNSFLDTTIRQFKKRTVLNYGYVIYNAGLNGGSPSSLQIQKKLYKDGKLILESQLSDLKIGEQKDFQRIDVSDAITLGNDLQTGEYVLQIVVLNKENTGKMRAASQTIDFEVTD